METANCIETSYGTHMMKHFSSPISISMDGVSRWLAIMSACISLAFTANVLAASSSAEELDKLVGPIALYPDDLVAIILPASTNPLQLVQADRFLDKRKADSKLALDENWDDSVKSLLNYPEVVKTMSSDLDWTSALGEAVVADQGAVLEAIQVFRRKTHSAGNLKSDKKQVVVVTKEIITIVPADPQVIYVPQYNPSTVIIYGGYSSWGYYPAPYPVYYYPYPPGAAFATGLIWGAAIGSAWNGGHYHADYHGGNANINIDRSTNINTGNINVNQPGKQSQLPNNASTKWKSNKQPGQVSGATGRTVATRNMDSSPGGSGFGSAGHANTSTRQSGGGLRDGSAQDRSSTDSRDGFGGSLSGLSDGSAFGGAGSGRQTKMDSSRGAASRSSMSGRGSGQMSRARGGDRGGVRR
jgi:hypothetical protein